MASKSARTLSFFFIVLGALELPGEKIIHHQRRDERGDAKILLRIVVQHVEIELVATIDQSGEKFVHPEFSLVRPLADRVQKPPPPPPQISARSNAPWSRGGGKELPQISVVEIGISILVKFALARVIGLELEVQTVVIGNAILRQMEWWFPCERSHQFIDVFEFVQRLPARVTLAPVEPRREPDRESLGEIFVRMALRIPVVEIHDITAAERARLIKTRRLFARRPPESLLPLFFPRQLIGIAVGMRRLMPHQFHEPLGRPALDLEHHRLFQRAQSIVDEKKGNENRRDADRHEPFIADVTGRMQHQFAAESSS